MESISWGENLLKCKSSYTKSHSSFPTHSTLHSVLYRACLVSWCTIIFLLQTWWWLEMQQ